MMIFEGAHRSFINDSAIRTQKKEKKSNENKQSKVTNTTSLSSRRLIMGQPKKDKIVSVFEA